MYSKKVFFSFDYRWETIANLTPERRVWKCFNCRLEHDMGNKREEKLVFCLHWGPQASVYQVSYKIHLCFLVAHLNIRDHQQTSLLCGVQLAKKSGFFLPPKCFCRRRNPQRPKSPFYVSCQVFVFSSEGPEPSGKDLLPCNMAVHSPRLICTCVSHFTRSGCDRGASCERASRWQEMSLLLEVVDFANGRRATC